MAMDYSEVKRGPMTEMDSGIYLELNSLIVEYKNLFDRSNKLDNKVYITITFCGFLFVFITSLFGGLSGMRHSENALAGVLTLLYALICLAVVICYLYLLLYFIRLLEPEHLIRMDPEILQTIRLDQVAEEEGAKLLAELYRKNINENLQKLSHRCDEFTKGIKLVAPTVILAFVAYLIQMWLQ